MVHKKKLKNIAEDSDWYTYIKPNIKEKDGRKDIKALRERFENYRMLKERVLKANLNLKNLVYRNERQITFEWFSTKFQVDINTYTDWDWDK